MGDAAPPVMPGLRRRVLQVVPYADENGTERHVADLVGHLVATGHEVTVASPPGPMGARFAAAGARWLELPALKVATFWPAVRQLAEVAREADLVHAHAAMEFVPALRWALSDACPPLVFTAHCYHVELDYAKAGLFLARADRVIAVSGAEAARLSRYGVPSDRLRTVVNGVPPCPREVSPDAAAAFRTRLGVPPRAVLVGAIGRLEKPKGFPLLMRAVHEASETRRGWGRSPIHLVIAGEGPQRGALTALAERLARRGGPIVHLPGRLADVPEMLAACDLYASASRREGLSLAALEALQAGKPLLVPDLREFSEVVQSGVNGLTFYAGSSTDLVRQLLEVLRDRDTLQRYGLASRDRAAGFTAERMGDRTLAVYAEALALRRSSAILT